MLTKRQSQLLIPRNRQQLREGVAAADEQDGRPGQVPRGLEVVRRRQRQRSRVVRSSEAMDAGKGRAGHAPLGEGGGGRRGARG